MSNRNLLLLFYCMHYKDTCARVCAQSCLTLYDPMDSGLRGSSVLRILRTRILVWVAMIYTLQIYNCFEDRLYILDIFSYGYKISAIFTGFPFHRFLKVQRNIGQGVKKSRFFLGVRNKLLSVDKVV